MSMMRWGRVNKTNFAKNQKGTISDSFNNAIRNKTLMVLAAAHIRKDDVRWNGQVVGTALKLSLKRHKKFLDPSRMKRSEKFHLPWGS